MLLDIAVTNYRCVRERQIISYEAVKDSRLDESQKFSLDGQNELLKASILLGANGSGKSTFIRALESVQGLLVTGQQEDHPLSRFSGAGFAYDQLLRQTPSTIEIRLVLPSDDGVPWIYTYVIRADAERIHAESLYRNHARSQQRMFEREYDTEEKRYIHRWGKRYEGLKGRFANKIPEDQLFLGPAAREGSPSLEPVYTWFAQQLVIVPAGLSSSSEQMIIRYLHANPHVESALISSFDSFDYGEIKQIRLVQREERTQLVFVHGAGQARYLSLFLQESLGLRRLAMLSVMFIAAANEYKFLVIDDIAMLLHDTLTRQLYTTFMSQTLSSRSQLMASGADTAALAQGLLRHDQLWLSEKKRDGSAEFRCLADYNIKKGDDVSLMYREGAFGAVPITSAASLKTEGGRHGKKA